MPTPPHPLAHLAASDPADLETDPLAVWRRDLLSRRRFLIAGAGGLAALFAPLAGSAAALGIDPWSTLAVLQDHLFPSEPDAPGAREIQALAYLRQVVADPRGDPDEQRFILKGVEWLEGLARQRHQGGFADLDAERRELVLREVASTPKGDNWLATLMLYLCEALLADPVYGGNPGGVGWAWLAHRPGFPRPTPDRRHDRLIGPPARKKQVKAA